MSLSNRNKGDNVCPLGVFSNFALSSKGQIISK